MAIPAILRVSFGGVVLAFASCAIAADSAIQAKSTAAVIAADDAWGAAETDGDYAFVDRLLLPGYESIGASGTVTTKETIVAGARARGRSPERAAQVAAWKAAHPTRPEVAIFGDTAVLTWVSAAPDSAGRVLSSDIFTYRDGHWRAVYSQHSSASQ